MTWKGLIIQLRNSNVKEIINLQKKKIRVWLISVVLCRTKKYQKQPSRGVLIKRLKNSANYRRTTMPKCGFNKVALQLYRNHTWSQTSAWVFFCKFSVYFQKPFPKNTSAGLLLKHFYFTITSSNRINQKS